MVDLMFLVEGCQAEHFAVAPLLQFQLSIANARATEPVHSISLRCQIRIEPTQRSYQPGEQEQLLDLFGEPHRWNQTLRSMLWTHTQVLVPSFTDQVLVDLPVPCTFDFNVAVTKYFHGLQTGEIPLVFLFSGTVFYQASTVQVAQIPWTKEARYRLPLTVWRDMMDHYYPNSAWLCLHRETFDRLHRYKMQQGLPTWEQALEALLDQARGR